jgi:hypothetical protein
MSSNWLKTCCWASSSIDGLVLSNLFLSKSLHYLQFEYIHHVRYYIGRGGCSQRRGSDCEGHRVIDCGKHSLPHLPHSHMGDKLSAIDWHPKCDYWRQDCLTSQHRGRKSIKKKKYLRALKSNGPHLVLQNKFAYHKFQSRLKGIPIWHKFRREFKEISERTSFSSYLCSLGSRCSSSLS